LDEEMPKSFKLLAESFDPDHSIKSVQQTLDKLKTQLNQSFKSQAQNNLAVKTVDISLPESAFL